MSDAKKPGEQEKTMGREEGLAKIGELVKGIHICMLTTAAADGGVHARPMAPHNSGDSKSFDGTLWFLTPADTGKVTEIRSDAQVLLSYADPGDSKYVALQGVATVSRDRAKIHELWNSMYKAWFPEGEDDPNIAVLRVDVTGGQYWEANASKIVLYAKYLAAAVTGGAVTVGKSGKVDLETEALQKSA